VNTSVADRVSSGAPFLLVGTGLIVAGHVVMCLPYGLIIFRGVAHDWLRA
jgi:hypothetical protein